MNFIFETAKRNLAFLSSVQQHNENAMGVILNHAAATRELNTATAESLVELIAAQGCAVTEATKANEQVMENAMRESREAVVKAAEMIARTKKVD